MTVIITVCHPIGGGGGIVESIVPGTGISVDDTDPANPIVSATGGGGSDFFSTSEDVTTEPLVVRDVEVTLFDDRASFDDEAGGFRVLVYPDLTQGGRPIVYEKNSGATADWDAGTALKYIDPDKFLTRVTDSGSGTEEEIFLTVPANTRSGIPHLVYYETQVDGGSTIRIRTVTVLGDYALISEGYGLLIGFAAGGWNLQAGIFGSFISQDSSSFPQAMVIDQSGFQTFIERNEYADYYKTGEEIICAGAAGTANGSLFSHLIQSDGSASLNTITIDSGDVSISSRAGVPILFIFGTNSGGSDTVTFVGDGTIDIVGGEVITLTTGGNTSWALFILTADGWLPFGFGGGATTDYVGSRVLQMSDTGALSWVAP